MDRVIHLDAFDDPRHRNVSCSWIGQQGPSSDCGKTLYIAGRGVSRGIFLEPGLVVQVNKLQRNGFLVLTRPVSKPISEPTHGGCILSMCYLISLLRNSMWILDRIVACSSLNTVKAAGRVLSSGNFLRYNKHESNREKLKPIN